jgi:hypothetical protein
MWVLGGDRRGCGEWVNARLLLFEDDDDWRACHQLLAEGPPAARDADRHHFASYSTRVATMLSEDRASCLLYIIALAATLPPRWTRKLQPYDVVVTSPD